MSGLVPKKNKPDNDMVYTPEELAKEIISHYKPSGSILEPCYGSGAFYNNYPEECTKHYCEIDMGLDFFDFDQKVDWIVTNPPWSKFKEFLSHSIRISDNIVFLVTINHYMTRYRLRIIKDAGFAIKEIYGVPTPKENWPHSGFQLAAVHIQRGYEGPVTFSGNFG